MIGYVYILINPAFPDLIKIGRTSKTSESRALELSTTGTPDKFVVVFDVLVDNCIEVESEMHAIFSSSRYAENREFFRVPVKKAIATLQSIGNGRIINEEDWVQSVNQNSVDWQSEKVKYCAYCALIDYSDVAFRNSVYPVNQICRFGLTAIEIENEEEYLDEQLQEIQIKKNLSEKLVEYYSNFGWVDFNDTRVKVEPNAAVQLPHFFDVFEMGNSQRNILENIVKESVARALEPDEEKTQKSNWHMVFDSQTLIYLPYLHNEWLLASITGGVLSALEEYYEDLKNAYENEQRTKGVKEAQLKKGNF
jgi:hypothetical protein